METKKFIKNLINENLKQKKKMPKPEHIECIYNVEDKIVETYINKKKTIICNNKGSAADALHFAVEMVAGFEKNREPFALPLLYLKTH